MFKFAHNNEVIFGKKLKLLKKYHYDLSTNQFSFD